MQKFLYKNTIALLDIEAAGRQAGTYERRLLILGESSDYIELVCLPYVIVNRKMKIRNGRWQ